MNASVIKLAALSTALTGALGAGALAQAAYQTGGVQLSFGLGLRTEAQDNRGLDATNEESSFETSADLSMGLLSETRSQRLSFDFGGSLRAVESDRNTIDNGFVNPFAELNYDLTGPQTRLGLTATLRETELEDEDLFTPDGLDLIRNDGGTRRRSVLEARLDWREGRPLGFGARVRREQNDYSGTPVTTIGGDTVDDSVRTTIGASMYLALSRATALDTTLAYSMFDEDGEPQRETFSLRNKLSFERPRGPITATFGAASTEDGERYSFEVGRTLEMPRGTLSGQIGATRATDGEVYVSGALDYSHALPRGIVTVGLSRDVSSGNDEDDERVRTLLNLGYVMELSPLSSVRLNADWARTEETLPGASSTSASLGATYSHDLTRDWTLDTGYRHRILDEDVGRANGNTVFLELRRDFVTRF